MTVPDGHEPTAEDGRSRKIIVIGLGNRYRQDDAIGLVVAERVREFALPWATVVEHDGDPLDLLPAWTDSDLAILVDALKMPGAAGEIRRFDPDIDLPPDRETTVSSHGHSLWDALELASLVRQRPRRALVFAIAGKRFGHGDELSPEVAQAVETVLAQILAALRDQA